MEEGQKGGKSLKETGGRQARTRQRGKRKGKKEKTQLSPLENRWS